MTTPNVLVTKLDFPAKSVKELLDEMRKNPGKVSFGSSGTGSSDHLTFELFAQMTGTSGIHVPYKGGAAVVTDLLGGQVDASFQNLGTVATQLKAGKIRALAVTAKTRAAQLPDVPTLAESGLAGYSAYVWMGMLAPKGTPPDIIDRLLKEVKVALATPEVTGYFETAGMEIVGSSPDKFATYFREERDRWSRVIKEVGAKID